MSIEHPTADPVLPTGTQYEISHGGYHAIVTEQGATLRSLTHDGRDVVLPFDADLVPPSSQGQHLLPWPNRIRDGHYVFDGVDQQLAINEPDRGTAIHGLSRWLPWTVVNHAHDHLTQRVVITAQPGWPGTVEATITHALADDGLTVTVTALNIGSTPVPFGYAAHPYLVCSGPIDQWQVRSPFTSFVQTDDRLLPVAVHPVSGDTDLRDAVIGARVLDTAFTGAPEGRWQVELSHGEDRCLLWGDEHCRWLQVYTPVDRASLAVEPMTCGPDAFNEGPTHDSMMRLEPGEDVCLRWGLSA